MLMALGLFVFSTKTAPLQQHARQTAWRVSSINRVGKRPSYQFLGPGDDTKTLSGTLYPELTGGPISLDVLRHMADTGKAWPLIEGTGKFYGNWSITSVEETATHLLQDGTAQKIEFSLSITRVDDNNQSVLATGFNAAMAGATGALGEKLNTVRRRVGL